MADEVRLKGVYGKPLTKMAGKPIPLTRKLLEKAAQIIVGAIQAEIRKDTAKVAGLRQKGDPVPLPKTKKFEQSFKWRISGKITIEITSDWPTATAHTTPAEELDLETNRPKPSAPMEMWWLRRPKVPLAKIVTDKGEVIVRTTPAPGDPSWVHPGWRKYTFLERGLKKGREKVAREIAGEALANLLQDHDLFGG